MAARSQGILMRICLNSLLIVFLTVFFSAQAIAAECILFSRLTDGYWQIWSMDTRGHHKVQLTTSSFDKRGPDWLRQGKNISYRTSNGEVFIADTDGKNERQVLARYGSISSPHFSKSSDVVVFMRFDSPMAEKNNIWICDLEGRFSKVLTKGAGLHSQPDLSLLGDKVVYIKVDRPARVHRVWVINADGTSPKQLTFNMKGFDHSPAFSPDGKSIVFASNSEDDDDEIYLLDIASGKTRRLTHHPGYDTHPRYSLDGKRIIFVSSVGGVQQIMVMDLAGGNVMPLTQEQQDAVDPVWADL